jgi:hypothetical protein
LNPLPSYVNGDKTASYLSCIPKQKDPEKQALLDSLLEALTATPPPKCYYCDLNKFKSKTHYERHVLLNHHQKLCYPDAPYIKGMNLKAQGCLWEE